MNAILRCHETIIIIIIISHAFKVGIYLRFEYSKQGASWTERKMLLMLRNHHSGNNSLPFPFVKASNAFQEWKIRSE